jgi:uncharacterized protein
MVPVIVRPQVDLRQKGLLLVPALLTLSMYFCYQWLDAQLGYPLGYLVAFLIYWIGWCLVLPIAMLGGVEAVIAMFRRGKLPFRALGWKVHLALWGPLLFPLAFIFLPALGRIDWLVLLISLLLGLTTGLTEEILWRGTYLHLFPDKRWLNTIYPSIWFGLWHLAPLSVVTNRQPGGAATFVLYAIILGLSYAYSARKTGTIRWCALSHVVHDTLGLGGIAYSVWLLR